MSKHTKGPWAATSREHDWWDSVVYLPRDRRMEICQCFHDPKNFEECTANARLIAAAPELLDALKAVMPHLHLCPSYNELAKQCHAAIAKAEDPQ